MSSVPWVSLGNISPALMRGMEEPSMGQFLGWGDCLGRGIQENRRLLSRAVKGSPIQLQTAPLRNSVLGSYYSCGIVLIWFIYSHLLYKSAILPF